MRNQLVAIKETQQTIRAAYYVKTHIDGTQ
jgi:hypothetical protein